MTRLLLAMAMFVAAPAALAQHHGSHTPRDTTSNDPHAVSEAFVVTGLRVDETAPPPGSSIGRAGLRYADGGYVSVVYGRPYARGRQVWGGVVGYGQVWAAGAHRATELVTTVPLTIGEARVEPGAYSLFLTPRSGTWTLHVNRALGMHLADEYDASLDLATKDAIPVVLPEEVEGLTWSFAEDGTHLRLAWAEFAANFELSRAD